MKNKLKSKNLKSAVLFLVDKNIKLGAFVIFLSMLGKTLMLFNRSESLFWMSKEEIKLLSHPI